MFLFTACPPGTISNYGTCMFYPTLSLRYYQANAECQKFSWAGPGHLVRFNTFEQIQAVAALVEK